MRFILLLAALFIPALADAATVTASSCNNTVANPDVETAVGLASNGDTVLLPDGTCSWAKSLAITTKYLTIRGEHDCTLDGNGRPTSCPTVITDDMPKTGGNDQMIRWTTITGGLSRLAHFSIVSGTTMGNATGTLIIEGVSSQWRMDHLLVKPMKDAWVIFYGYVRGVNDHNKISVENYVSGSRISVMFYTHHSSWGNVGNYGDNSWASACDWGGSDWLFFEDNEFAYDRSSVPYDWFYAHDGWMGGRIVFRNNVYTNTVWANHGLESGGRQRGQRCTDTYNNTFTFNLAQSGAITGAMGPRGGEQLYHGNAATVTNGTMDYIATFNYERMLSTVVDGCNTNYEPFGYPGRKTISSITRSGSTATVTTSTDHGFRLTNPCPFGCYVKITGANQSEYNGVYQITPVTCNTFTYSVSGTPATPATGTMYQASPWDGDTNAYGYLALDQIGAGASTDVLANEQPTPRTGNTQVSGPSYCWSNTINGSAASCATSGGATNWIEVDRDWFGSAKGGYTAYTYPHPLQGLASSVEGSGSGLKGGKGLGLY